MTTTVPVQPGDDLRLSRLTVTARELAKGTAGALRRVSVQLDGACVELEWDRAVPGPADAAPATGGPAPAPAPVELTGYVVRSPIVGTFYRAQAPGEPPFVAVGGTVDPDTVIGIVEAMKLMNHITAGHHGVVRSVLLPDGSPVEFDQPLVLLDDVVDEDECPDGGPR